MSLPALAPAGSPGLSRSAALMRALGSKAAAVWATLTPQEAERLSEAMQHIPDDLGLETAAARSFVQDMAGAHEQPAPPNTIWATLSAMEGQACAAMIVNESPQVIAVILSKLKPEAAANTVRALPEALATEALHRLINLGPVRPAALRALETSLQNAIDQKTSTAQASSGHERVARIFDGLDGRTEQGLLAALDRADPGSGDRIRALMFTFNDLSTLDPASIQTLLANTDRAVLILALKGAKDETAAAFFNNMTSRARNMLREEIEAAGPVRRSEIETARAEILTLARTLVKRGDILSHDAYEDELVE